MLSLRARTLLTGLAVSALPAAADCSKNVPLGMTLPTATAHVTAVAPNTGLEPPCPGDAVHFPSSNVVFDDGKRRWWNGRPSEWNALHRDDYDKFLDAGYQESILLKPYCLDRHEVTVGEYIDCVDNGTCAPLDPTPLFVQMGLEHRLPDRRGTGTISDPFHADEYLDETIALFEFDGLDGGGYTSTSQLRPHAVCPIAIGGVAAGSTSELVAPSREGAVVCVKFLQADAFCRARGGRLPTAPEWQFAAMGPKLRRFPWGDVTPQHVFDQSGHPVLDVALPADFVGADLRGGGHALDTTPEGVQDLYGNVMEWADATPVEMLAAEQAKPTLLPGTAGCHNCVDPSQVTFAMGTLFPHGRIGHGDNVADSAGWPCDLCEPKVYGWEYRSPYLGFRCAYDARER